MSIRRLTFAAVTCLGLLLPALLAPAWATPGRGKPMVRAAATGDESLAYHVDSTHDGTVAGGIETPPFTQQWSRTFGAAVSYPLVTHGKVYVIVPGSGGTSLYAIDGTTGNNAWGPLPVGGSYSWAAITAGGGNVYSLNNNGLLVAFDLNTGLQKWAATLPGQYMFTSPPTYFNGVVYSGGAGVGGTVYANRASDGLLLWTGSVMNGDNSSPAVSSDGVFVSYACPQAYDFNPTSGALNWHYSGPCEGGGGSTPTLAAGRLWIRDGIGGPLALNASTGAVTGTFASGPLPAFDGDNAFFLEGSVLQARNASTLAPVWSFSGDGKLDTAPIVDNGYVYIGSSSGQVWALNEATGVSAWSANAGSAIGAPGEYGLALPSGLAAGQGLLVVPASSTLVAYASANQAAPAITSATQATFAVHATGSFTVVATGAPAPTVTESGTLPSGITFDSATGTLTGAPAQGSVGTYPITFTAANGVGTNATQNFTLTVNQATMTYPTDGQSNVDTTKWFSWSTIPEAQAYHLIIGTKQYGADLVDSGVLALSQASWAVSPALPVGPTLYVTLYAKVNGQWTSYQAITFTAAPGEAAFTFPLNSQVGVDPTQMFTWSTVPQSDGYILVVGTTHFGSDLVHSLLLPPTQASFATPVLPANRILYATLLTKVNGAYTRYQAITFTTGPAVGILTHPVNGQTHVATPGTVTWNGVAAAQNYWLVVGTSVYGKELVDSGLLPASQHSLPIPALPQGKTLYATLLTKVNGKWGYQIIGFTAG